MRSILSCLALLALSWAAHAGEFVRLHKQNLETAIASYEKDGVKVDLIGVVHIADRDYYKQLNKKMDGYDALLYELVTPMRGFAPPAKQKGNPLVKAFLGLDSQLERINYKRANFVHADLSLPELKAVMEKRGDDIFTIGLRLTADILQQGNLNRGKQPNEVPDLSSPDALKLLLAKQLATQATGTGLKTLDTLLIKDRNERAIEVFEAQRTKGMKNMGIFYGAAHMPDMERRLTALGFRHTKTTWLTAWDLSDD